METRHAVVDPQLGELTLVAAGDAWSVIYFPGHWDEPVDRTTFVLARSRRAPIRSSRRRPRQLRAYLGGEPRRASTCRSPRAAARLRSRCGRCERIPFGETTTYGTWPRARRATTSPARGSGGGHNPLAMVVPCHRVVGKTANSGDTRAGLTQALPLDLEGAGQLSLGLRG